MSINVVVLSGNIGTEPELRSTASGMQILSFTVAVNDRRKNNQTGEWEEHPNWVSCTMFGERAARIAQYLNKGTKVSIDGKLRYSSWSDNQGNKRSKLDVVIDDIEFMSNRQQGVQQQRPQQYQQYQQYQQPQQQYQQPQQYQPAPQNQEYSVYDEDIPFN